jgi:hypothetical protein
MSSASLHVENGRITETCKKAWKATGKTFASVGYQWRPTGRKFNLGRQNTLPKMNMHKIVKVKEWRPTGRKFNLGKQRPLPKMNMHKIVKNKEWRPTGRILPLESQCLPSRSCPVSSSVSTVKIVASVKSVVPEYVCADQMDPNCTWGSTFFSYPLLSGFKCRSYRSSCGIWTQAAQNI